jgi:hypothetical protein
MLNPCWNALANDDAISENWEENITGCTCNLVFVWYFTDVKNLDGVIR